MLCYVFFIGFDHLPVSSGHKFKSGHFSLEIHFLDVFLAKATSRVHQESYVEFVDQLKKVASSTDRLVKKRE